MTTKTFPAERDLLDDVTDFAMAELLALGCPKKSARQFILALEELFVNVASYAYGDGKGDVSFEICKDGDMAVICMIDSGKPFNPLDRPDPDTTLAAEDRKIGGLGIYMSKKLLDGMEYEYKDNQNRLTMKKSCV